MSLHRYDHTIDIGRAEITCAISYEYQAGYAGDWIDPPEPAAAEILKVKVGHSGSWHDAPAWLLTILEADEDLHSDLVYDAENGSAADRADFAHDERMNARAA